MFPDRRLFPDEQRHREKASVIDNQNFASDGRAHPGFATWPAAAFEGNGKARFCLLPVGSLKTAASHRRWSTALSRAWNPLRRDCRLSRCGKALVRTLSKHPTIERGRAARRWVRAFTAKEPA